MKWSTIIISALLTLSVTIAAASEEINNMGDTADKETPKILDIDEAIELQNDLTNKNILTQMKNQYQSDVSITVQEYQDYWEIIIDHPDTEDGFTGGAECYHLNKITGESEMIWHEHPMQIEESTLED